MWEDLGDVQFIRPTGIRLDVESWDKLIDSVAPRNRLLLVIDFSGVQNISTAILAKLINLKKELNAAGSRLKIEHIPPDGLEVFRMTRLDQLLGVEP